jgi:phage terminase large subunit
VVIRRSWIDAAIDFHIKFADSIGSMSGKKAVGYDVADSGDDKNATVSFDGSIAMSCDEWQAGENELNASAVRAKNTANALNAMLIYDSIGVGAHTGSTLMTQHFTNFAGFNAGGKVFRPNDKYNGVKQGEYFANIKAQAWWLVADRLRNTYDYVVNGNTNYKPHELISISSKMQGLESLKSELCTPRRDFDQQGRVKVESKKDLAARGIKSPNKADAFIMAANPGLVRTAAAGETDMIGF